MAILFCAAEGTRAQSLPDISNAWAKRSADLQEVYFNFRWEEKVEHFKAPGQEFRGQGEFAMTADGRIRLVCDSYVDRSQQDSFGAPVASAPGPEIALAQQRSTFVYDGTEAVRMFSAADDNDHAKAFVSQGDPVLERDLRFMALQLFARPLDEAIGMFPGGIRADVLTSADLSGQKCIVVKVGNESLWVTADERLLPLRNTRTRNGSTNLLSDLQISYDLSEGGVWVPASWKYVRYGVDGETILETREARVTDRSIGKPLHDALFRIEEFPGGTWVTNAKDGEERVYIKRVGKPDRSVLRGEFNGKNYQQLLNSEPPIVSNEKAAGGGLWLWIGNGVLLAAIAAVWYWRSRRAKGAADG